MGQIMSDAGTIIVGGERFAVGGLGGEVDVLTWHDHGVQFRAGEGFNKKRNRDVTLSIFHWTGSENPPLTMVKTLRARKLGVEFAIDRDGCVYQFADPIEVDTADAGPVNARSVGIEIVNYGVRSWDRAWLAPKLGKDRVPSAQRIHGRYVTVAGFYPAQVAAACALADTLSRCPLLRIARAVPVGEDGRVTPTALAPAELAAFSGHIGHLHVTKSKLDPGLELIADIGFALATAAEAVS